MKAIIFDFDGTVVNSQKAIFTVIKELGKKYEYEVPDDLTPYKEKSAKEIIKEFNIPVLKIPRYVKEARKLLLEHTNQFKLVPSMKFMMQKLMKKYQVGILTSNSKDLVEKVFEKNDLRVNFIHAGTNLFGKDKALKSILRKLKVKKDEVLYVGDELRDIEACKKVGILCISVTWGLNTKELLKQHNEKVIEKPKELYQYLPSSRKTELVKDQ